jgi:hypothetical protein
MTLSQALEKPVKLLIAMSLMMASLIESTSQIRSAISLFAKTKAQAVPWRFEYGVPKKLVLLLRK